MQIKISGLQDGEHHYYFNVSSKDLDLENYDLEAGIDLNVNLYKSYNQFTVKTELSCKLKCECDRCLENIQLSVYNEFELVYKFNFGNRVEIESDDNYKILSPDVSLIDIKNDVRDYFLLSVPMKKIPPEKDGICLFCKTSINEILNNVQQDSSNPVWEKLLKNKNQ